MQTRLLPAGFALRPDRSLYYTLLLMLVGISSVFAQTGTIRYVKAGGTGNGSAWANASGDLQAMINASAAGDQVWVAAGIYKPTSTTSRTASFAMRPDLAIYGGFVGNETSLGARPTINPITGNPGSGQPSSTTLSGDIGTVGDNSDNSYHVIANFNFLTTTAILDGFVITGGNANLSSSDNSTNSGGGMRNFTSFQGEHTNPLIRNCSFVANSALSSGGAVYNGAVGCASDCSPTLINCFFQGNSARQGGAMANSGSVYDANCGGRSNPTLTNCSFVANSAIFGGAMFNSGFGSFGQSNPTLTNCSFVANSAVDDYGIGGAMYNVGTSKGRTYATLTNCSFLNNTATYQGGAIANNGSDGVCDPTLTNCSFQGNTATYQGGAMFNTSVANTTTGYCTPQMTNCVVFGNGGTNTFYGIQAFPQVYYSLVEASVTGWQNTRNNLTTALSPFAGTNTTQLRANAPAINAGDGSVDAGATDLAGNPRIVGCKIDMGAFEFQYIFLPIAINAQPASSSVVCAGTAVSVPVSVSGTVSGYQWYKDSFANPVAGQTSATLTLNNPQPGNAGSYSLVVTSNCNSLTSTAFNLTVNKSTVSISPSSATVCQGQSALLTASGASSYTWSNNTTGNTLTATTTGTYSVTGVDGNGCSAAASAQVTVYRPPVSISPGSVSICEGQSTLLTASGASAGETLSYTWNDNTTGNTLTATTTGTYSVTGVDGRGCSNTATASVTVNNVPTVSISASPSATITQGSSVTLTAVATGATAVTWVTGSTNNSIVVSPTTSTPYSVTARSGAGCTASASLTLTVLLPTCNPIQYVTQQGAGLRDGSSWSNALGANQLQIAINTAADCGGNRQVWVAAGVYKPTNSSDRNASFSMRNGVAIYGGFAGTETALTDRPAINPITGQPSSTTLSGDIGTVGNTSDNSFRVISNPASLSLTTTAVLDGFVITGGAGGTLGGGMFNDASSPAIRNCSFVANAVLVTSTSTSRGGAIYNGNGSSPQLTNCRFEGNSVSGSNGNASYGGAMSNFTNSSPLLLNCSFLTNSVSGSASNFGGAMANNVNSNPQLINCSFISNSAVGGTTTRGGAINNGSSSPQLINCSFLSNSVSGASTNLGGAIANGNNSVQLTNCVLFNNGGNNTLYNVSNASVTANYSLFDDTVTGYTPDPTDLTASSSPFASTTSTQLATGSPAINTGSNQAYQSGGGPATDLAGNTWVFSGTIDMGAYEYQSCLTTLSLTNPSAITAVQYSPYNSTFITSGGTSLYSYSLASGTLPIGLTLTTSGVLSGTPTQTGNFSITVRAIDANGCSGISPPFTLTVIAAPVLSGFAASASSVCVGSVTTFTATVSNFTGSYSYTLTNGLTPPLTGTASSSTFGQSLTAVGIGSQLFTLQVLANGQDAFSQTMLTVDTLPVASLSHNGTLSCGQTSVTLTADGGSSYTFATGNGLLGTPGATNTLIVNLPGTYSVTVASANGCVSTTSTTVSSNTATVTVTNPTTTTATQGAAFSQPFTAAGGVGPYSYSLASGSSSLPAGLSLSSGGVLSGTATQSGSFALTVRASDANGCPGVSSVYNLAVSSATPTITGFAAINNPVCAGSTITFTATVGNVTGSYTFTLTNGSGTPLASSTSSTAFSQSLTAAGAGSQSFTLTVSANGQLVSATTSLTVNSPASATIAYPGSPFNTNSPAVDVIQTGTSGGTYTSVPAGLSLNASTGQITPASSTPGTYTVTYTVAASGGCGSFTTSTSVDIQLPSADLSIIMTDGISTVTPGSQLIYTIQASNAGPSDVTGARVTDTFPASLTDITWTAVGSGGGTVASASGSGNINQLVNLPTGGSVTFTVRATLAITATGNLINTATVVVPTGINDHTPGNNSATDTDVIRPLAPTLTNFAFTAGSVCTNSPVTFTATVGNVTDSYNFTLTNGSATSLTGISSNASFSQTLVASGSGVQNFTLTVGANGQLASSTTSLTVNSLPTAGLTNNGPLTCGQTSVTLAASGGSSYTFVDGSGNTLAGNDNIRTVSNPGTYSVTVANAGGCVSTTSTVVTSATAVVTVNNPVINTVAIGTPFSQTFSASGGTGAYRFSLVSGNPPTGLSLSTTGVLSGTPSQGGSFTIAVRASDANGCSGLSSAYVLTVDAIPTIMGFAASPLAVCVGSPITFTATIGNVPNGYSWNLTNGGTSVGSTSLATATSLSAVLIATGTGVQTFTLTVTANGQTVTGQASVIINALPTASLTNNGPLTCAQTSVTLTAAGGSSYRFADAVGTILASTGNTQVVSTAGVYSVTVTNASGCSTTAVTSVGSNTATPSVSIGASSTAICLGQTSTLTASGANTYQWNTGQTTPGISVSLTGTYSVTGTTLSNGCSAIISQFIQINPLPLAPTLVTQSGHPYAAGVSSLTISQNVGSVILTVSGCAGGNITWDGGNATTLAVSTANTGVFTVAATCLSNGCTSAAATATITVVPSTLTVLHRDADYGNTQDGIIRPYLQLANLGNNPIPYGELTVRYWFTSEGSAPPTDLSVYYAQLGAVQMRYVPLAQPRQGAYGYVEYSFPGGGNLPASSNSGPIENGILKTDRSAFNELDDYSYLANYSYTANSHITAYRNGVIVWGQEPAQITGQTTVSVYSAAKDQSVASQVQTRLELRNEGNLPINAQDLTFRYYFTSDNGQTANAYVDYAAIGAQNVQVQVVRLNQPVTGADSYVELKPTVATTIAPMSSLGAIDFRIVRSDYGLLDQNNDYSYAPFYGNVGLNTHITAYLNNTLVFGTEPTGAAARVFVSERSSSLSARVLGNPVTGPTALVEISGAKDQTVTLNLVDGQGRPLHSQRIEQANEVERVSVPIGNSQGTLLLRVSTDSQKQSLKLVRP